MTKELRPGRFRKHASTLALTIPADYVREMGLVPNDTVMFKREPDGLRLRIIRHSKLLELANTPDLENQGAQNGHPEQEVPVAAE